MNVHDRKARKVSSVMGCELRRQLSEPGAGDCCESMVGRNRMVDDERNGTAFKKRKKIPSVKGRAGNEVTSSSSSDRFKSRAAAHFCTPVVETSNFGTGKQAPLAKKHFS